MHYNTDTISKDEIVTFSHYVMRFNKESIENQYFGIETPHPFSLICFYLTFHFSGCFINFEFSLSPFNLQLGGPHMRPHLKYCQPCS